MPPRKTRAAKEADKADAQEATAAKSPSPPPVVDAKGKGKQQQQDDEAGDEVEPTAEQVAAADDEQPGDDDNADAAASSSSPPSSSRTTMEERRARLLSLKQRLSASSTANRKDLHLDKAPLRSTTSSTTSHPNPRRNIGKEHKLRKAEATLDRRDADEAGRDYERVRNWGYSMEDQERWEEKLAEKEESRDKGLIDANGLAARSYQRGVGNFKPDLRGYKASTSGASSSAGGSSSNAGAGALVKHDAATGSALIPATSSSSTLSYGTHRPSGEAVDRVITHLNMEADARNKRSRKRPAGQEDEEITYINEKNAHFNRKINRFFDEHTSEIRENFERGTAL